MSDYLIHQEVTTEQQKLQLDANLKMHKITEEEETKRQQVEESNRTKRVEERHATLRAVLLGLAILLVISGVGFLIWTWTTGPGSPKDDTEMIRERECIASGGGWVPENLLSTTGDTGLCVYPGKKVQDPSGQ